MQEIINKFLESLENGNYILVIILAAVALLMNAEKIQTLIDSRKKRKIENIKEALESDYVKDNTKAHLKDLIETEYFKLSTGVHLEKEFREALIKLHRNCNGELRFVHFKRALLHLVYKDETIHVEISNFEKFLFVFNIVIGFIIGLYALVLIILPILLKDQDFLHIFYWFFLAGSFLLLSLFMISQTFPIVSARKIENILMVKEDCEKKNLPQSS